jgi:hypothetical protein
MSEDTASEDHSKEERAKGVQRMLSGEDPPREPPVNDPDEPATSPGADKVGESTTRRGEDIAAGEKEPGRHDTGVEGGADRPTGTSTARDRTSIDPQEPAES